MGEQLERVEAGAELFQTESAAERVHRRGELLHCVQMREYLGFLQLQGQVFAGSAAHRQLLADEGSQRIVLQRCLRHLDQQRHRFARVFALGDQLDRALHHVTVDQLQHAVVFGDLQERAGQDQLAIAAVQPQQGVVNRMIVALQIDDRLEMQDEALLIEGFAQPLHPGLDALDFGAVHRIGVEQLKPVAADPRRRLHALAGFRQRLTDAGVLLADLHASDAGGDHAGALADDEHFGGEGVADTGREGGGSGVVAVAQQHREAVLGKARGDRVFVQFAA